MHLWTCSAVNSASAREIPNQTGHKGRHYQHSKQWIRTRLLGANDLLISVQTQRTHCGLVPNGSQMYCVDLS